MRVRHVLPAILLLSLLSSCRGGDGGGGGNPDVDADDDGIQDVDEGAADAVDTDGDEIADYLDDDSDGDGISDAIEAGDMDAATAPVDTDGDQTPDFRDLDSDGDCLADAVERRATPPADSDTDGTADYLDRDSDGDRLRDGLEDASCDGVLDAAETDAVVADTDADGADDLVETVLGTDARDADANPAADGDTVFVAPSGAPSEPASATLPFTARPRAVDLYVLIDRSGSMSTEIIAIRNNLATLVNDLQCPPVGDGDPSTCIEDLWAGAGAVGYADTTSDAFRNFVDLQPSPDFSGVSITEPSNAVSTEEPLVFALWASITGLGGGDVGLTGVPARATCAGSPAAGAGYATFGYPCFREGALPVVVLATDEAPLNAAADTFQSPSWASVGRPAFLTRGARFLGVYGDGASTATQTDLRQLATETGSVDASNSNAPLVFEGGGANAPAAIESGVLTLTSGVPLDLGTSAIDDGADSVDAVTAFVERFETYEDGATCTSDLATTDTNADTFPDGFLGVLPGTPVCFTLHTKPNASISETADPQLFRFSVDVVADGISPLGTRDVFVIVPPVP